MIPGHATPDGTARYRNRIPAAPDFYSEVDGLHLSSVGLGTYLGDATDAADRHLAAAIEAALHLGCNVFDAAINYRGQRSERTLGRALGRLVAAGAVSRDEVLVSTKGGYIPFDGRGIPQQAIMRQYVEPGIVRAEEIVAWRHCIVPSFLRDQIGRSLRNLGLEAVDLYYVHNPEEQLAALGRDEFLARMRAAFEALEGEAAEGRIRAYGTATWDGFRLSPDAPGHLSLAELVAAASDVGGRDHGFRFVQLPYNMLMTEAYAASTQAVDGDVVPFLEAARRLGVHVVASAALMQGRLARGLPQWITEYLDGGGDAQRALQFVRSTPGVVVALAGMGNAAHVEENLAVAALPRASSETIRRLYEAA